MKQLILWKEVDVKEELPPINEDDKIDKGIGYSKRVVVWADGAIVEGATAVDRGLMFARYCHTVNQWHIYGHPFDHKIIVTHWLKRIVLPIYDDQEIEKRLGFSLHLSDCAANGSWATDESKCDCRPLKEAFKMGYAAYQEELLKALQEEVLINSK